MKVFLVGIKGVAMAALAVILTKMGYKVEGSDVEEEFITDQELNTYKIKVKNFEPSHITNDLSFVVYSGANQGRENPQIIQAQTLGIKVYTQTDLLNKIMKDFSCSIGISGSHGKTTTSALLAHSLIKLGAEPSYMVGSSNFGEFSGGDFRSKDYFVFEADEYAIDSPYDKTIKLELYKPDIALITNIDFDHPDVYEDLNHTKRIFTKFFRNSGKVYICRDDQNSIDTAKIANIPNVRTFGTSQDADFHIYSQNINSNGISFKLKSQKIDYGIFSLKLFGEKNVLNSAGVISVLLDLGFSADKIKSAIRDFRGAKRRFELKFSDKGTYLFDDYAHHPKEIEATINAAKEIFKNKRIIIVFQSHTYSRTQKFLKDFAKSLSLGDFVFILPIFSSAREKPQDFNVSSQSIVDEAKGRGNLKAVSGKEELIQQLTNILGVGDIVFTMGAGNQNMLAPDIIELIRNLK